MTLELCHTPVGDVGSQTDMTQLYGRLILTGRPPVCTSHRLRMPRVSRPTCFLHVHVRTSNANACDTMYQVKMLHVDSIMKCQCVFACCPFLGHVLLDGIGPENHRKFQYAGQVWADRRLKQQISCVRDRCPFFKVFNSF